jgi:hypothetical protein
MEITGKALDYVRGRISLKELRDFIAPKVWDIESFDTNVESLVYGIELVLSEHDHGHLSVDDLKEEIRVLVGKDHG